MKQFEGKKNILLVGAGSGADILSSLLLLETFTEPGVQIDVAGFLTPWASHSFGGTLESPLNVLDASPAKKVKITHVGKEKRELPFFETDLYEHLLPSEVVRDVILFSLQHGTKALEGQMQGLVDGKRYDLILAVDVGGDILADATGLRDVFTPIVDFTCLNLLAGVRTAAQKTLVVVAPGIDGEMTTDHLKRLLKRHRDQGVLLDSVELASLDPRAFIGAHNALSSLGVFHGHTPKVLRRILNGEQVDRTTYTRSISLDDIDVSIAYDVLFDPDLYQRAFLFDLVSIAERAPVKPEFQNLEEAYRIFKSHSVGGTEIDLSYLYDVNGEVVFVANMPPRLNPEQERTLLSYIDEHIRGRVRVLL